MVGDWTKQILALGNVICMHSMLQLCKLLALVGCYYIEYSDAAMNIMLAQSFRRHELLFRRHWLPKLSGAIDGTHILILCPLTIPQIT